MAVTVSAGSSDAFGIDAAASLTITNSGRDAAGTISFASASPDSIVPSFEAPIQEKVWGPFLVPMRVSITVTNGSCSYQPNGKTGGFYYNSSGDVIGLTGPDGELIELGGAGGSPGGSDTNVQFNNDGAFGGDAAFTWGAATAKITLGLASVGSASVIGAGGDDTDTEGVALSVVGGSGFGAGSGGTSLVSGGAGGSTSGQGGSFIGIGGDGGATGAGGDVGVQAGTGGATSGAGGTTSLAGGNGGGAGAGGGVNIVGGAGVGADGGTVVINGGVSDTARGGSIDITAATSTLGVNIAGGTVNINAGAGKGSGNGGDIKFTTGSKGASSAAGNVVLNGSAAALATSATGGFTTIPTCAGTPSGTPASVLSGNVAMIYDTTGNKLWIYNGAWKSAAFT